MDVFPALLDGDIPFYSHEIDAYWNDIGIGRRVRARATSTRWPARSRSSRRSPRSSTGIYAGGGSDLDGVKVKAPVLIGPDCAGGDGVDLHGPVVVGDGCQLGAGRDAPRLRGSARR